MADQDQTQGQQGNQEQKPQTAQITGTVQIQPGSKAGAGDQAQGGKDDKKDDGKKDAKKDEKPEDVGKKRRRTAIIVGVVLLLAILGSLFYWRSTYSEDTDDAQIDGNLFQVSSRVTGQVIKVYVEDNTKVEQGALLAEIDPKDYVVALDQAQANLASTQAAFKQATVNIPVTSTNTRTTLSTSGSDVTSAAATVAQTQKQAQAAEARVAQAKANAIKAQLDVDRYTPLVQKDVISKQQYDAAVAQAAASNASVLEAQADVIAQQEATRAAQQRQVQASIQRAQAASNGPKQIAIEQARASASAADVKQAEARVEQAQLNLSYCKITAPTSGIINKKNFQVGANLAVGQNLTTIVPLTDLWVTANFKETQLNKMKPNQNVKIKVDALNGREFSGKVSQIGGATGSMLSLFPPENATGNYVKVVQRIPVRIDFTNLQQENGDYALRPGFSVEPKVAIK